jgi:serine/threonine protein kinase
MKYRSPEEFTGDTQDESRDTFALGSGIYTLLTGLWPFYDEDYRGISHTQIRVSDRLVGCILMEGNSH